MLSILAGICLCLFAIVGFEWMLLENGWASVDWRWTIGAHRYGIDQVGGPVVALYRISSHGVTEILRVPYRLPLCALELFLAGIPAVCIALRQRDSKRLERYRKGLCVSCGYDLRASASRCPECGKKVENPSDSVSA